LAQEGQARCPKGVHTRIPEAVGDAPENNVQVLFGEEGEQDEWLEKVAYAPAGPTVMDEPTPADYHARLVT
jgi:hypothetical protein